MPALVVPDAFLAVTSGSYGGQPWVNVHGLRTPDPVLVDQSVADEVAAAFRALYVGTSAARATSWVASEFVLQDLRTATSPAWDAAFLDVSGTVGSGALPPHIAVCASHTTGFRGKSYRGRTYHSGFGLGQMNVDGTIFAGLRTDLEDDYDTLRTTLAGITAGVFELAVVSRTLLVATPIVSTTVGDEFDQQNRRKRSES